MTSLTKYLHIDIETRSELDIKTDGLMNYAHHESTHILCICFKIDDEMYTVTKDELEHLGLLQRYSKDPEVIFCAHNASFEYIMLHAKNKAFNVPINRWRCSAAVAAYHRLPRSLGACAKTLGLAKQKDEEGKKVMMKMCKPLPPRQQKEGKWFMNDEAMDTLISYCKDDVLTEEAIIDRLGFLPPEEQELFEIDFEMNWINGVQVDIELCKAAQKEFKKLQTSINDKCMNKYGFKLTQVAKVAEFLGEEKCDAAKLRDMLEDPELPADKKEVIEWRQAVGNTSPSKFKAIQKLSCNGRVYGMMLYHGAGTGRWTSKGVQLQNLARGSLSEDWVDEEMEICCGYIKQGRMEDIVSSGLVKNEIEVIKSTVRGAFTGDLSVCDYSQIEARILPWIAGQTDVVDAFEQGLDIYKVSASQIYKKKYEDVTKDERFIGKIATLALGYQGGKGAFLGMAEVYGVKDMDETFAEKIKIDWRKANNKIVQFWYALDDACREALKSGRFSTHGVEFTYAEDFLKMKIPSGRTLFFYKPEIRDGSITYLKQLSQNDFPLAGTKFSADRVQVGRVQTYGGKLCENCIAEDTEVLTDRGWVKIQDIELFDKVHDGVKLVNHKGLLNKGVQTVMEIDGVYMTPDHEVLTNEGWKTASQHPRPYRPDLWNVDGYLSESYGWKEMVLGIQMRVRSNLHKVWFRCFKGPQERKVAKLWMFNRKINRRKEQDAWDDEPSSICSMEIDERQVQVTNTSSMEELRRSRYSGLQKMARKFRGVLGRCEDWLQKGVEFGSHRQRWGLFKREYALGFGSGSSQQQEGKCFYINPQWSLNDITGFSKIQGRYNNNSVSNETGMARGQTSDKTRFHKSHVYDIMNCGDLHRFVVRGKEGPFIVHNCVQAIARDVMVHAIRMLPSDKIAFSVHDELICDGLPLDQLQEAMLVVPKWAEGLPIGVDGWAGRRYRK